MFCRFTDTLFWFIESVLLFLKVEENSEYNIIVLTYPSTFILPTYYSESYPPRFLSWVVVYYQL